MSTNDTPRLPSYPASRRNSINDSTSRETPYTFVLLDYKRNSRATRLQEIWLENSSGCTAQLVGLMNQTRWRCQWLFAEWNRSFSRERLHGSERSVRAPRVIMPLRTGRILWLSFSSISDQSSSSLFLLATVNFSIFRRQVGLQQQFSAPPVSLRPDTTRSLLFFSLRAGLVLQAPPFVSGPEQPILESVVTSWRP